MKPVLFKETGLEMFIVWESLRSTAMFDVKTLEELSRYLEVSFVQLEVDWAVDLIPREI